MWRRWAWFATALVTLLAVDAELHYVPVVWDIVTYAQSYAGAHLDRGGLSQGQYIAVLAKTYLLNVGFLAVIALVPASLWLLMLRAGRHGGRVED